MPSDMREAVIAAWMDQRRGPKLRTDEATADAALAVIRARLAEKVRHAEPVMPERIQLRRTKGWRMPPNTVSVARPSLWSNPWRVARRHGGFVCENTRNRQVIQAKDRSDALDLVLSHYRAWLASRPYTFPAMRGRLGGKNLGCFCALDQPCHADILLEIANA